MSLRQNAKAASAAAGKRPKNSLKKDRDGFLYDDDPDYPRYYLRSKWYPVDLLALYPEVFVEMVTKKLNRVIQEASINISANSHNSPHSSENDLRSSRNLKGQLRSSTTSVSQGGVQRMHSLRQKPTVEISTVEEEEKEADELGYSADGTLRRKKGALAQLAARGRNLLGKINSDSKTSYSLKEVEAESGGELWEGAEHDNVYRLKPVSKKESRDQSHSPNMRLDRENRSGSTRRKTGRVPELMTASQTSSVSRVSSSSRRPSGYSSLLSTALPDYFTWAIGVPFYYRGHVEGAGGAENKQMCDRCRNALDQKMKDQHTSTSSLIGRGRNSEAADEDAESSRTSEFTDRKPDTKLNGLNRISSHGDVLLTAAPLLFPKRIAGYKRKHVYPKYRPAPDEKEDTLSICSEINSQSKFCERSRRHSSGSLLAYIGRRTESAHLGGTDFAALVDPHQIESHFDQTHSCLEANVSTESSVLFEKCTPPIGSDVKSTPPKLPRSKKVRMKDATWEKVIPECSSTTCTITSSQKCSQERASFSFDFERGSKSTDSKSYTALTFALPSAVGITHSPTFKPDLLSASEIEEPVRELEPSNKSSQVRRSSQDSSGKESESVVSLDDRNVEEEKADLFDLGSYSNCKPVSEVSKPLSKRKRSRFPEVIGNGSQFETAVASEEPMSEQRDASGVGSNEESSSESYEWVETDGETSELEDKFSDKQLKIKKTKSQALNAIPSFLPNENGFNPRSKSLGNRPVDQSDKNRRFSEQQTVSLASRTTADRIRESFKISRKTKEDQSESLSIDALKTQLENARTFEEKRQIRRKISELVTSFK